MQLPSKSYGYSLRLFNKSKFEQIVRLQIDQDSLIYKKENLQRNFDANDLAPCLPDSDSIVNCENRSSTWFIECPESKRQMKGLTLKMGPQVE